MAAVAIVDTVGVGDIWTLEFISFGWLVAFGSGDGRLSKDGV
jgi:hypothetical protein